LKSKLESSVAQFSFYDLLPAEKSETLLISYGVTARACKAVYKDLQNTAHPISLLILKTLWPVPVDVIRRAAEGFKRIVVVEMNLGQYVGEIKRILPDRRVDFYGQMDGRLIAPLQIKETIING
jgi:2-oxoglutarate ferredoxin oxidoreductase subunit alpha